METSYTFVATNLRQYILLASLNNNWSKFFPLLIRSISSVQLLSCVRLFATSWIAARQASLSITNSRGSLRLTSIESVMPSSHLILCRPLLLLPPIPPSIRVFSNESTLCMRSWLGLRMIRSMELSNSLGLSFPIYETIGWGVWMSFQLYFLSSIILWFLVIYLRFNLNFSHQ